MNSRRESARLSGSDANMMLDSRLVQRRGNQYVSPSPSCSDANGNFIPPGRTGLRTMLVMLPVVCTCLVFLAAFLPMHYAVLHIDDEDINLQKRWLQNTILPSIFDDAIEAGTRLSRLPTLNNTFILSQILNTGSSRKLSAVIYPTPNMTASTYTMITSDGLLRDFSSREDVQRFEAGVATWKLFGNVSIQISPPECVTLEYGDNAKDGSSFSAYFPTWSDQRLTIKMPCRSDIIDRSRLYYGISIGVSVLFILVTLFLLLFSSSHIIEIFSLLRVRLMFLANPFDDPSTTYVEVEEIPFLYVESNEVFEGYNSVVMTIAKVYRPQVSHMLLVEQEDDEEDLDDTASTISPHPNPDTKHQSPNEFGKVLPDASPSSNSVTERKELTPGQQNLRTVSNMSEVFMLPVNPRPQISGVFREDGSPAKAGSPHGSPKFLRVPGSPRASPRNDGGEPQSPRGLHRRKSVHMHREQLAVVNDNVKYVRKNLQNNLRERQRKCAVMHVTLSGLLEYLDSDQETAHEYIIDFVRMVCTVVQSFDGIVFHISPSEIRCSWNTHIPHANPQLRACECALELHRVLFTSKRKDLFSKHNISIDSGKVTHGVLSGNSLSSPVVYGACTESMPIIHSIHQVLGTKIIITERVFEVVQSSLKARIVDVLLVSEALPPVALYELLPGTAADNLVRLTSMGFNSFRQHKFTEARGFLEEQLKENYDPQTARLYKLAAHYCNRDHTTIALTKPYCRRFLGWLDLESTSSNEPLPEQAIAPFLDEEDAYETLAKSFTRRVSFSAAESYLRNEIMKARRSQSDDPIARLTMNNNNAEPQPAPKTTDVDMLAALSCFEDAKGRTWRCSEKILGRGAFGEVRMGMGMSGELVAMKLLRIPPEEAPQQPNVRGRPARRGPNIQDEIDNLIKEVGLLTKMRHDNVVSFLSCAVVGTSLVIVSEFVSGGSLMGLVEDFGKISTAQVKRYIRDVLKGLRFLHNNHVCHLDIKPHNVLVQIDGQCKLTDFGASAQLSKELMHAQGVHGTPLYMAPEQCKGKATSKSDIWGVGIMTYQLLTGSLPYVVDSTFNPMGFMFRLGNDEANFGPQNIDQVEEIDKEAKNFIYKCLERNQDARPTADELLLEPFLALAS